MLLILLIESSPLKITLKKESRNILPCELMKFYNQSIDTKMHRREE